MFDYQSLQCPNTLSLVSFVGMTLNKCDILWIRTLKKEKSPPVLVKESYGNLDTSYCNNISFGNIFIILF